METTSAKFDWNYLIYPGIAMLLGWGLRGYIGGGPFGAMIPGAMVALAIAMLLNLKPGFTGIVVVFAVVGVGLGGEMTYGQTLGFLRSPDTVWWGNLGTTVKGAVWGLGGGTILGLGLIHRRMSRKTILISFLLLIVGLFIGFKLINDPKVIYFSDPINKPRSESWAGLLVGSMAMLGYLRYKLRGKDFSIIFRFAILGLISGGLGFGIGGLWIVLGSHLPDALFANWWKMMEFTFGLLFGMGLGYAAWLSRNEFENEKVGDEDSNQQSFNFELLSIFAIGLMIYLIIPITMEPLADQLSYDVGRLSGMAGDIFRIIVNYAFYGFLLVLIVLYRNELAWQIGITLTFCHTAIDYMRDLRPQPDTEVNGWIQLFCIAVVTMLVAYLLARYRRRDRVNNSMFQILIWSTIFVAFLSLFSDNFIEGKFAYTSFASLIVRTLFVHFVFLASAIYVSWKSYRLSLTKS